MRYIGILNGQARGLPLPLLCCPDQGLFVTVGKFWALETVAPYLMGKIVFFYMMKVELFKKSRLIRQGENSTDLKASRFVKAGIYQLPADSLALMLFRDCQRPYLCQVFPADMEGADALNTVIIKDNKVAQMVIERADGSS